MKLVQPTGRNFGGYHGDTIEIATILDTLIGEADRHGWTIDEFPGRGDLPLFGLRRGASLPSSQRVHLSTGIHGDEPAGPMAALRLIEENRWPDSADLWLCPCLNPTGFPLNTRENLGGVDLNRDYRHQESLEVRAHVEWLKSQADFDYTLCLHEDWEARGFYLYELNPDRLPAASRAVVEAVSECCPIDPSEMIDGRVARGGVILPELSTSQRPRWPEAFHLVMNKCRLSYTLEAPSDFTMETRVQTLCVATMTLLAFHDKADP